MTGGRVIKSIMKVYLVYIIVLGVMYSLFFIASFLALPYILWMSEFGAMVSMFRFKEFRYSNFKKNTK